MLRYDILYSEVNHENVDDARNDYRFSGSSRMDL